MRNQAQYVGIRESEAVHKTLEALGFQRRMSGRVFTLDRPEGMVRIQFEDTLSFALASRSPAKEAFAARNFSDKTKMLHFNVSQSLILAAAQWSDQNFNNVQKVS